MPQQLPKKHKIHDIQLILAFKISVRVERCKLAIIPVWNDSMSWLFQRLHTWSFYKLEFFLIIALFHRIKLYFQLSICSFPSFLKVCSCLHGRHGQKQAAWKCAHCRSHMCLYLLCLKCSISWTKQFCRISGHSSLRCIRMACPRMACLRHVALPG